MCLKPGNDSNGRTFRKLFPGAFPFTAKTMESTYREGTNKLKVSRFNNDS
jgi:hypothetical protein